MHSVAISFLSNFPYHGLYACFANLVRRARGFFNWEVIVVKDLMLAETVTASSSSESLLSSNRFSESEAISESKAIFEF